MTEKIERKYHLFDAQDKSMGRLATEIVRVLRGKNKVSFTPHIDAGDFAVVINAKKIKITGNKKESKIYYRFSGYPGGLSERTLKEQIEKDATKVIQKAVYGMLPKNKLRDRMMTRLFIFEGEKHDYKINGIDFSQKNS
jgi:large subunit ribosomal protein L13